MREIQERLGIDAPLAGFLTSDSLVEEDWDEYPVMVESEVAVEVGADGRSIVALLPALEIADPPDLDLPVEQILAGNIFHRAVAFGPRVETQEPGEARILVNGTEQHTVPADRPARGFRRWSRRWPRGWRTPARSSGRATGSSPG